MVRRRWKAPAIIGSMRLPAVLLAVTCALAAPAGAIAANDPLRSDQPNLNLIESDAARANSSGKGAIVAIIDTGVKASHPDLQGGRLLQGYDFVDNDGTPQDDVDGHGTHVLGIVGAAENNGVGISSVAPGARLLPVRVLDNTGSGDISDVADGIDYAVAQGAHVINLSLGSDVPLLGALGGDEYDDAIRRALEAGRVVVASSGNNGAPACEQPSADRGLLCVGAVDDNGTRTSFSSFGAGLGLMAPGRNVLSTFADGGYTRISGTSQASPHVSGVAALLVGKGLRGQEVVNRLLGTTRDAGAPGPDGMYGAGIVNARQAVAGFPPDGVAGRGPGTGRSSSARIKLLSRDRIRNILRRGVRVRCRAAGSGRCRVYVSRRGKRLAQGSRKIAIGRSLVATARLNRRGRAVLRSALRRKRRLTLRVRVTLPGSRGLVRRLKLRP
jgi:subtilisin family serine protease